VTGVSGLTAEPGPGLAASPTGYARSCTRRAAITSGATWPGLAELLLADLLRTLVLPTAIADWSLRSGEGGKERTKVVAPVAANLVFQMAGVAVPRELFLEHPAADRGVPPSGRCPM
jgi:hypothetical protein